MYRFIILAFVAAAPLCRAASDLEAFERNAARAKQLGATHVVITEDLPPALWEMDVPGDPYPAWYMYHPGLLKIFPPAALEKYVDQDYAERVAALFQARCEVLRRLGLKAAYTANEPHVLPEAFFADHPDLRGPRVDHANRSRTARFAPCVDQPATLALYREALQKLLKRLPEVEVFSFTTTDAGSGLCWTPALYPGLNGPSWCQRRPMEDRVAGFLTALQRCRWPDGPADHRGPGRDCAPPVDDSDLRPSRADRAQAARRDGRESSGRSRRPPPRQSAFRRRSGRIRAGGRGPAARSPRCARLMAGGRAPGTKFVVSVGDTVGADFNFKCSKLSARPDRATKWSCGRRFTIWPARPPARITADDLLSLWMDTDDAERYLGTLNFGPVLTMGGILGRWVNRPLVPFPENLTNEEKSYYRPFLFQAKGEEQADDLIDIQAMRMYEGWGARLLVQNIIEKVTGSLSRAEALALRLREGSSSPGEWELLGQRLAALQCLVRGVDDIVEYQAQLDRVKALSVKPDPNPVLGAQSGWDRTDLMRLARNEIDNAMQLRQLLLSAKGPLLDLAPTPAEETIRRLGPDLPAQLKRKMDIMNAHWEDYKRLFTTPNP